MGHIERPISAGSPSATSTPSATSRTAEGERKWTRARFLGSGLTAVAVLVLGSAARAASASGPQVPGPGAAARSIGSMADASSAVSPARTLALDVCCDAATFRFEREFTGVVTRGWTCVVAGRIFPGGTFAGTPVNPDSPGGIGEWLSRATFYYDSTADEQVTTTRVETTQYYSLANGSRLVTVGLTARPRAGEGAEEALPVLWRQVLGLDGGAATTRLVIGGTGEFARAHGALLHRLVGTNATRAATEPAGPVAGTNMVSTFLLVDL